MCNTQQTERLNKELQAKCAAYESQYQSTTNSLARLREDVEKEVERRCAPLRDALAQAQATLVSERVQVAMERSELAELWPQGWLMPTILQPYKPLTVEEYERYEHHPPVDAYCGHCDPFDIWPCDALRAHSRLALAQERDAERALREEIRANMLERTMWTKQLDPYGRTYYSHRGTGEACWEVSIVAGRHSRVVWSALNNPSSQLSYCSRPPPCTTSRLRAETNSATPSAKRRDCPSRRASTPTGRG